MLRIIDGKRYNTETATKVCEISCPHSYGDFKYHDTALYLTRKGSWFLAGKGNAMSRWAHRIADGWGPGSGVEPLTPAAARSILESENESELCEKYFGSEIIDA